MNQRQSTLILVFNCILLKVEDWVILNVMKLYTVNNKFVTFPCSINILLQFVE